MSFNPPAGWQSIKLENLYGGRISTTTIPETAGDYGFGVIEEDSRDNIKEGGIVTKTATYQAEKTLSFNMDKWKNKNDIG